LVTESYTVAVRYNEGEAAAFNGQARNWQGIPPRAGAPLSYMPIIYDGIISFLEECVLTRTRVYTNHVLYPHLLPLRTALICQDSYDKDNLPAVAFILLVNNDGIHTDIDVISRRIYDANPMAVGAGNHMAFPMPANFPGFDNVIAELTAMNLPNTPRGFVPSTNLQEWTCPMYTIQPVVGNIPAGTVLADLIRNTGFNQQLTEYVRVNIRNIISHLLTQTMPNLLTVGAVAPHYDFAVNVTNALSTTDGEGAISLSGRAGFNQQIFKGLHPAYFWGISNPAIGVGVVLPPNPHITPQQVVPGGANVVAPAWDWAGLLPAPQGVMIGNPAAAIGGRKSKRNRKHKNKSRRRR